MSKEGISFHRGKGSPRPPPPLCPAWMGMNLLLSSLDIRSLHPSPFFPLPLHVSFISALQNFHREQWQGGWVDFQNSSHSRTVAEASLGRKTLAGDPQLSPEKCLGAVMSFLCCKPPCTGCRAGRRRRAVPATKLLAGLGNEFQEQAGINERIILLGMRW